VTLLSLVAGCQLFSPAPPPEPEPPACTLSADTLDGRVFVREVRNQQNNGDEPDRWARMRFEKAGNALQVVYNSRAPFDMYRYTCAKEKGGFKCLQDIWDDAAKLKQVCQTLWANKGSCSPAEVAEFTGAPVDKATAAAKEINDAIAKMKPQEKDQMKLAFSQPNNQLRGTLKVKINTEACKLAVVDTYQTMTDGQVRELETYVGNSRFLELTEELPFTKCDGAGLVAADTSKSPPEPKREWAAGDTVPFLPVPAMAMDTPDPACTYSMDIWSDFGRVAQGQAVAAGADGKLAWTWSGPYPEAGKHVVQMTRYKACGGEPQKMDDLCTMIQVQ
jgi:hypothetical protein